MRTMSIKEVERLTGINRANIRFYEKEGLITPVRNTDNNYRTYMDTDIQLLKKIKLLRALGIPVAEITRIKAHPESFSGILGQRLLDIEKEQQELVETKKVCRYLLEQKLVFSTLAAWYMLGKVLDSPWKISILFSIVAFYIALRWQVVNRNIDTCNRYYATTAVLNILAVPTLFVKGVGDGQSWRRGDKEYH